VSRIPPHTGALYTNTNDFRGIHIKMIKPEYIGFFIGLVCGIIGYELWIKWESMSKPKEESK